MPKKIYSGEIPFHPKTGHPMYYPATMHGWEYKGIVYDSWMEVDRKFGKGAYEDGERVTIDYDWRPNEPFRAKMKLVAYSRGRSAANFDVEDENGVPYTVFMKDTLDLLRNHGMVKGETDELTWVFCKRGENYGIRVHDDE